MNYQIDKYKLDQLSIADLKALFNYLTNNSFLIPKEHRFSLKNEVNNRLTEITKSFIIELNE